MSNQNIAENSTLKTEERIPLRIEKKDAPKKNFLEIVCPYCHGTKVMSNTA